MISYEDCVAMCGLTAAEIEAIAEHEHLPHIVAASLGRYLLDQRHGEEAIRDMIRDDIRCALDRSDARHASELVAVLRHFLITHPQARQTTHS